MIKLKTIASNLLLKHSLLKKLFAELILPPQPTETYYNPIIPKASPAPNPEGVNLKVKEIKAKYNAIINTPIYSWKTFGEFLNMIGTDYIAEETKQKIVFTEEAELYLKHLDKILSLRRQLEDLVKECNKLRVLPIYEIYAEYIKPNLHNLKKFLEKKIQKKNMESLYGVSPDPVFKKHFGPKPIQPTTVYTIDRSKTDFTPNTMEKHFPAHDTEINVPLTSLNHDIRDLTMKYVEAMSDIQFQAIEDKFYQKQEALDNELIAGKISSEKHVVLSQRLENEKAKAFRDLNNEFKSQLLGTERENQGVIHRVRKNMLDMREPGQQMQELEEGMDRRQEQLRKNLVGLDKTLSLFKAARQQRQAKIAGLSKIEYAPKSNLKMLATSIRNAYIIKEAAGELLTPEHLQNMPEGWRQGFQKTLAPETVVKPVEVPKPVDVKPNEPPTVQEMGKETPTTESTKSVPDEVTNVKAQPTPSESQLKVKQQISDIEAKAQRLGASANITDLTKEMNDFEKTMWDENGTPKDPNVSRSDFDNYRKRMGSVKEKLLQDKYTKIRTDFSGNSDRLARELEEFEKTLVQDNVVTELGKQYGLNDPSDLNKIDSGSRKMARNNRADREWRKMKESFYNTWENADLLGPVKGIYRLVKSLRIRYPGWTTVTAVVGSYCLYRFMFGSATVAKTDNKEIDDVLTEMDQTLGTDTNVIAKLGHGLDIVTSDLGDLSNTIEDAEEKNKIIELSNSLTKTKSYLMSFKAVLDLKDKSSVNAMFENSRKITQVCQQWSTYIPSLIQSLNYPNTEELKQTLQSLQIIFTQIPQAIEAIKEEARK